MCVKLTFCGLNIKRKDTVERDSDKGEAKSRDKASGITNLWRWDWLETAVEDADSSTKYYLAEVIQKLESPGHCYCIVCDSEIKYSTRGNLCSHWTDVCKRNSTK